VGKIRYFKNYAGNNTSFYAQVEAPESEQYLPHDTQHQAVVNIHHADARPNFRYMERTGEYTTTPGYATLVGTPTTLFHITPPEINFATTHPRLRAVVPTLMALAVQHGGPTTRADSHLSAHSARLAKRAHSMGLIQQPKNNPYFDSEENEIDWDTDVYAPMSDTKELPHEQVAGAKKLIRSVLGRNSQPQTQPRPKSSGPKPEQLRLF